VDVRNDPGGYLEQSVKVASEWLSEGTTVVIEKRGDVVQKEDKAVRGQAFLGIPTIVLVNEGSASASEILAGALRDNNVAKIVGMKTYGKGSVQQVAPLGDGSAVKITIARWYTPAGKNIDKEGIEPDEKVEITKEQLLAKQDPQKDRAVQLLSQ
jgi:carboxyl-terminal processing protease